MIDDDVWVKVSQNRLRNFVLSKNDGGQLVMVVLFYKKRKSRIKTFTHKRLLYPTIEFLQRNFK